MNNKINPKVKGWQIQKSFQYHKQCSFRVMIELTHVNSTHVSEMKFKENYVMSSADGLKGAE